jgi:5-methylcytosine-specific restriction endonuclease McrA
MKNKTKIDSISKEEFKKVIESSVSIKHALLKLGYKYTSASNYNKINNRIRDEELSVSHMLGHKLCGERGVPLNEILVQDSQYNNNYRLKLRIIKAGLLQYTCCECNNNGEWLDKTLTLQLDHKNGINNDNRLSNLRFLCPNCHSQTETYCGKQSCKKCKH